MKKKNFVFGGIVLLIIAFAVSIYMYSFGAKNDELAESSFPADLLGLEINQNDFLKAESTDIGGECNFKIQKTSEQIKKILVDKLKNKLTDLVNIKPVDDYIIGEESEVSFLSGNDAEVLMANNMYVFFETFDGYCVKKINVDPPSAPVTEHTSKTFPKEYTNLPFSSVEGESLVFFLTRIKKVGDEKVSWRYHIKAIKPAVVCPEIQKPDDSDLDCPVIPEYDEKNCIINWVENCTTQDDEEEDESSKINTEKDEEENDANNDDDNSAQEEESNADDVGYGSENEE